MTLFRLTVLVLVIFYWLSGIKTVGTTDVGILTRFGKVVPSSKNEKVRQPGIVLALPKPIDNLLLEPKTVQELEISKVWASLDLPIKNNKIDPLMEGYCLTGDQNVVQTKLMVKYFITDAQACRFGVKDPQALIESLVLASLTQSISGWGVDEVLQLQRTYEVVRQADGETSVEHAPQKVAVTEKLGELVMRRAQTRLDALESGITLNQIEFLNMHYPRHVNKEFVNVQTARIAAETERHAAEGDAGRMKQGAKTLAGNVVTQAQTYRQDMVAQAGAERREFEPLFREYQKSPDLVWQRIYMDTVQQVMGNVGTVDFVPGGTRVILPSSEDRK